MRRRPALCLIALAAAAAGVAVAQADDGPGPNTKLANTAVNDARQAVWKGDRACAPRFGDHRGTTTHDPPPADMLALFAVLRRPATPSDAFDAKTQGLAADIAIDYVRRARILRDGTSVYAIPSLDARPHLLPSPADCRVRERAALEHRLRGLPARAQRAARRDLAAAQGYEEKATHQLATPGLFVLVTRPSGGYGGGGGDAESLAKYGNFVESGRGHDRAQIVGLVPDGVARIDFTFARAHGRTYRRSVAVVDNVVALTVPRRPADPSGRQVWRRADGSVVNVVGGLTAG
jgi:hypothetical protein